MRRVYWKVLSGDVARGCVGLVFGGRGMWVLLALGCMLGCLAGVSVSGGVCEAAQKHDLGPLKNQGQPGSEVRLAW